MAPILNSISPLSGPPGTAITLTGTGFDATSQVACPVLVPTTLAPPNQLTATVPEDLEGADGASLALGVYVRNGDGSASLALPFTVLFPATHQQSWTDVVRVCGEVPGFQRGGNIADTQIQTWIESVAQSIAGAMLRRGLSLDPSTWQQPGSADLAPAGLLEMVNRMGAAARLAAAIAGQWGSGEWGLAKNLERSFSAEMTALGRGDYDKFFRPGAATVEAGPLLAAGDTSRCDGTPSNAFSKGKVF
jgi:hypothetical protein